MAGTDRNPPVLVVDDDPNVAALLAAWISDSGWSVRTCGSGIEALQILDDWTRGVVLADLRMPDIDGLALCRALRDPSRPWTPFFILLTGDGTDPDLFETAFEQGVDDFVAKPVSRRELLGRLRAALRVDALAEDLRARSALEIERRAHQAGVEELREVVAALAHDLRTPIAALRTTAETLAWKAADREPDLRRGLDLMVRTTIHLSETVTDVADAFQCDDADRIRGSWKELDLAAVVRDACEISRPGLAPGVALLAPDRPFPMRGNPTGLRRLAVNLLSNALRATAEGSIRVEVREASEPGTAILSVGDTGPGIPPSILARIGEPLLLGAGSSRRDRAIHGAGLGMAICRGIASAHGGRMLVETSPGGTSVLVHLRRDLSEPETGGGLCPLDREARP